MQQDKAFGAVITRLIDRQDLSREGARAAFEQILQDGTTAMQQGAFLAALRAKGETEEEVAGAWEAIYELDTTKVAAATISAAPSMASALPKHIGQAHVEGKKQVIGGGRHLITRRRVNHVTHSFRTAVLLPKCVKDDAVERQREPGIDVVEQTQPIVKAHTARGLFFFVIGPSIGRRDAFEL